MIDAQQRFLLPAEWAEQSGVMLTWPHSQSDWGPMLDEVEPVFVEIAHQISLRETLLIICFDGAHLDHIQELLCQHTGVDVSRIRYHTTPSNDTWARDHAPITVCNKQQNKLLDFTFNGWGNKHPATLDNAINQSLNQHHIFASTPMETVPLVLEGGGIETDGEGTMLTTSRCLLSPERNPQLDRQQVEQALLQWFGTDRVLWLENGYLAGDDTDSHIDTLARFCPDDTIIYVACDDPDDEHYPELKAMEQELQAMTTRQGEPYRLLPLPWPSAKYNDEGDRLPASYANYLLVNGAVLAPTYDDPADQQALAVIQRGYPQHQVIGIPCLPLIHQFGSLHCVTMQFPAGVL